MSEHERPTRYVRRQRVSDEHLDRLGHVNNVVYLQWVQDVAADHWTHASSEADRAGLAWVAVRHEIDYKAPAFADDELELTTWVEGWTGVTSDRHTEITRCSDGTLVAKSRTVWCAVDPESLKPIRVDPAIRDMFVDRHS